MNYLALECLMVTHEISVAICLARKKKRAEKRGNLIVTGPWMSHLASCNLI